MYIGDLFYAQSPTKLFCEYTKFNENRDCDLCDSEQNS